MTSEYRLFRLVRVTGWSVDQIESTSAERLDWFLAFADLEAEVRARGAVSQDQG